MANVIEPNVFFLQLALMTLDDTGLIKQMNFARSKELG